MHVLAKFSLMADVVVHVNTLTIADFGKLSVNVKHKSTKFANVHTTPFLELGIEICDK